MALANDDGKIVTEQLGDKFETFPVRMAFQAGYAQFEDWTSGTTFHCGIGYFHPFGQCKYYMGEFDMAEAAGFPISDLFTEKFSEDFCDMGFAIYRLPDGDIYCYDGIFGTLISGQEGLGLDVPSFRNDVLLNVVCGGTGRNEDVLPVIDLSEACQAVSCLGGISRLAAQNFSADNTGI